MQVLSSRHDRLRTLAAALFATVSRGMTYGLALNVSGVKDRLVCAGWCVSTCRFNAHTSNSSLVQLLHLGGRKDVALTT